MCLSWFLIGDICHCQLTHLPLVISSVLIILYGLKKTNMALIVFIGKLSCHNKIDILLSILFS